VRKKKRKENGAKKKNSDQNQNTQNTITIDPADKLKKKKDNKTPWGDGDKHGYVIFRNSQMT
jgi:hypothetical protein